MSKYKNKVISANSKGIVISYGAGKSTYVPYKVKSVEQIQLHGSVKYQEIEKITLNKTQQKLYSQLLYGIKVYSKEEIASMHHKEITKIIMMHKKTQIYLNKLKQEVLDTRLNNFLTKLFPKSPIVKDMCAVKSYDRNHLDKHTFKELGLTPEFIASKLVETGLLPKNFFQLV